MACLPIHYTKLYYPGTEQPTSSKEKKSSIPSSPSSFAVGAMKDIHLKSPTIQADPAPIQYTLQTLLEEASCLPMQGGGAACETFKWIGINRGQKNANGILKAKDSWESFQNFLKRCG